MNSQSKLTSWTSVELEDKPIFRFQTKEYYDEKKFKIHDNSNHENEIDHECSIFCRHNNVKKENKL